VVGQQVQCCLEKSATFACDFPPVDFLDADSRHCSPNARMERKQEAQQMLQNRGV
jgi:hypothetical protein